MQIFTCSIAAFTLAVAAYLAISKKDGWGWFLFVGWLLVYAAAGVKLIEIN